MKKSIVIIIALVVLGLFGLLALFFGFIPPGRVRIFSEEIKYSSPDIEVNVKIPVIRGMSDKSFQARLNSGLENSIVSAKDHMIAESFAFAEDANAKGFSLRQFQLFQTYNVTYNKKGILSFHTETYQYSGGAHGMTVRQAFNIDLKAGQMLKLKDLFKGNPNFIETINKEIERQIALNPDVYFSEGDMKFRTIIEDQPFYIVDGAVVVFFPLYEIAPYSTGMPEFKIGVTNELQ
jgi:hypothetical protein